MRCIMNGCKSSSHRLEGLGVSYFSIAYSERQDIFNLARRSDIHYDSYMSGLYKSYKVCHHHFSREQYTETLDEKDNTVLRRRLKKPGTTPTQNLPRPKEKRKITSPQPAEVQEVLAKKASPASILVKYMPHPTGDNKMSKLNPLNLLLKTPELKRVPTGSIPYVRTPRLPPGVYTPRLPPGVYTPYLPRTQLKRNFPAATATAPPIEAERDPPTSPLHVTSAARQTTTTHQSITTAAALITTHQSVTMTTTTTPTTTVASSSSPILSLSPGVSPVRPCPSPTMTRIWSYDGDNDDVTAGGILQPSIGGEADECNEGGEDVQTMEEEISLIHPDPVIDDLSDNPDDQDPEDYYLNHTLNMSGISGIDISSDSDSEEEVASVRESRKHIVYQTSLLELYKQIRCKCGERLGNVKIGETKGSLLILRSKCVSCSRNHVWRSQPKLGQKARGNVELIATMFLTGQMFSGIEKWCRLLDLQFVGRTSFYKYQRTLVMPQIQRHCQLSLQQARQEIIAKGEPVNLAGDGRYDSPGHSARYCTYTLMDADSGKVTHNLTLETATRTSAVASEKEAFVAVFEAATSIFNVRSITTDGNTSIRAFMRLQDAVKHGLDIWHICKNLAKNLAKKAKSVLQKPLLAWLQHLTNHVWWSAASCDEDPQLLREMVLSMGHHTVNRHDFFPGHEKFKECRHEAITENEERQVQFLQAGDPAHKVLVEHLRSKAFMDQLSLCTHGVHTGRLEVLHSMFLAYVSKRVDYDPSSYNARIQLAVMDHNENCSRRPVLEQDGITPKLRMVWTKSSKSWRLRAVYEPKTYKFRSYLLKDILADAVHTTPPNPMLPNRGARLSKEVEKPDFDTAVKDHLKYRRF